MTFSEMKFELKRKGSLGLKTVYAVPKSDEKLRTTESYIELPYTFGVDVTVNKHGKKVLSFNGGWGDSSNDALFFFDKEMANIYSSKLQARKQLELIEALNCFNNKTQINTKLEKYLDKYPEVFVWFLIIWL